jgi:DNA-binding response OmpR family regulator
MKEIVEKHGGNVWFYSQLNEGSEFHFTVPEAKNIVLIVESDNVIKSEYKKSIEHNLKNFEIRIVDNGYEAISLLKEILPTIIITNHDMPLMSGIQLVEALKKRDSSSLIPIIVVGTQINEDIRKSYSRLGIERIITKPIDQELLIDKMRECIF